MTQEHGSNRSGLFPELGRIVVPLGILAIGAIIFVILSRQREVPARVVEQEEAPLVETALAVEQQSGLDIEVDGVVVPYREIELSAEVDGKIEYKNEVCQEGSYVKGDTLLLKIDARDYELDRDRLSKELDQADASCKELEAEIENTEALIELAERQLALQEADYKRQQSLHADRVVSDSQLDQAAQSMLQAENALLTLRNQLRVLTERRSSLRAAKERAESLLEKAKLDLTRTEIRVPEDTEGVVISDLVERGDYVKKGTPLVTIEDTSKVEVRCSLRVEELYWLWNQSDLASGQAQPRSPDVDYQIPRTPQGDLTPVTVVYSLGGQDYQWQGVLSRYEGIGLDEATRTFPCRVTVESPRAVCVSGRDAVPSVGHENAPPNGRAGRRAGCTGPPALVRGMYVTVKIHAEPRTKLVRIPEAAVRPGNIVWAVRNNKLAIINVRVVRVASQLAIIVAGELQPGDRVVVTPLPVAENGMAVREEAD